MPSLAQRLIEQGIEKGKEQGIEQGAKNNAKETALRMLSAGLSIEDIAKFTGLTEKEVKDLMN
jgi:predicted transposase/invertase (TIGR01784 family)